MTPWRGGLSPAIVSDTVARGPVPRNRSCPGSVVRDRQWVGGKTDQELAWFLSPLGPLGP